MGDINWSGVAASMYHAYGGVTDHKNFRGEPMPEWEALPPKIQEAWIEAAKDAAKTLAAIALT